METRTCAKEENIRATCGSSRTVTVSTHDIILLAATQNSTAPLPNKSQLLLFRPLLLADCCSLNSDVLKIHPLSGDKCAKLLWNLPRYLRLLLDLSFAETT